MATPCICIIIILLYGHIVHICILSELLLLLLFFYPQLPVAPALKLDRQSVDGRPMYVSLCQDKSADVGQSKFKVRSRLIVLTSVGDFVNVTTI